MRNAKLRANHSASYDVHHWLGEGLEGQDTLISEIDADWYSADRQIYSLSQSVFHQIDKRADTPHACIWTAEDSIPWHIGWLSNSFRTVVVSDSVDPILESYCVEFRTGMIHPEDIHQSLGMIDFFLFFPKVFSDLTELLNAQQFIEPLLTEVGVGVVLTTTPVFVSSGIEFLETPSFTGQPEFGASEFSKRNRDFFGKGAKELIVRRLYQHEVYDSLTNNIENPRKTRLCIFSKNSFFIS